MINKFKGYFIAIAFLVGIFVAAGSAVHAQDMVSVTKKVYNKSKAGVKRGYRIGHQVGGRVWTGSKWVAAKSWNGGTWVARKTANGTKWIYRKGKRVVVGTPARRP